MVRRMRACVRGVLVFGMWIAVMDMMHMMRLVIGSGLVARVHPCNRAGAGDVRE